MVWVFLEFFDFLEPNFQEFEGCTVTSTLGQLGFKHFFGGGPGFITMFASFHSSELLFFREASLEFYSCEKSSKCRRITLSRHFHMQNVLCCTIVLTYRRSHKKRVFPYHMYYAFEMRPVLHSDSKKQDFLLSNALVASRHYSNRVLAAFYLINKFGLEFCITHCAI